MNCSMSILRIPTKFEKPMDQELIDKRFANLSDTFLMQYEKFGENLVTFLATIKQVGERETKDYWN